MDKAVDFLKRNWWVLPATLVTGYFVWCYNREDKYSERYIYGGKFQ